MLCWCSLETISVLFFQWRRRLRSGEKAAAAAATHYKHSTTSEHQIQLSRPRRASRWRIQRCFLLSLYRINGLQINGRKEAAWAEWESLFELLLLLPRPLSKWKGLSTYATLHKVEWPDCWRINALKQHWNRPISMPIAHREDMTRWPGKEKHKLRYCSHSFLNNIKSSHLSKSRSFGGNQVLAGKMV